MGIKCPKCKSNDTKASSPGKMFCYNCSNSWKPYKHLNKKMKYVGDGVFTERKRVIPGAKTETIGDGIFTKKRRVKKVKKESFSLW